MSEGGVDLSVWSDRVARHLAVAGFAELWRGRATRPAALRPTNPEEAEAVVALLAEHGRAELDGDGRLVGIHGLTLGTTRHRIVYEGGDHWTWCAFDAIGIPAALGVDATAHTDCPTCRAPLAVEINKGVPADDTAALWLPGSAGNNLMSEFCAQADLYCSRSHLEDRIGPARTPGRVVDVRTGAALGRATWSDVAQFGGTLR